METFNLYSFEDYSLYDYYHSSDPYVLLQDDNNINYINSIFEVSSDSHSQDFQDDLIEEKIKIAIETNNDKNDYSSNNHIQTENNQDSTTDNLLAKKRQIMDTSLFKGFNHSLESMIKYPNDLPLKPQIAYLVNFVIKDTILKAWHKSKEMKKLTIFKRIKDNSSICDIKSFLQFTIKDLALFIANKLKIDPKTKLSKIPQNALDKTVEELYVEFDLHTKFLEKQNKGKKRVKNFDLALTNDIFKCLEKMNVPRPHKKTSLLKEEVLKEIKFYKERLS